MRTATDLNGDVYFCLTDVADVLEISNANPSRFNLDEAGVHKMYISYPSGSKQVTFINEPNLYRVIFRSNKEQAILTQPTPLSSIVKGWQNTTPTPPRCQTRY